MFLSHRRTGSEALDAWLETHALVCSRHRLHVVRNRNVVSEDALSMRAFDRKGRVGRPVVTVVLEGFARIGAYGKTRTLERGDVSLVEAKGAIVMRQGRDGEPYRAIALEWEPESIGVRPNGFEVRRLGDSPLGVIERAASTVAEAAREDLRRASEAMASIVGALRTVDAPLRAVGADELIEPVPDRTRELAAALDVMLSDLRRRPMTVDLDAALGLSGRQIQRVVRAFNEHYGFNSGTWQDTRSRRRVMIGAALMTAPGAETAIVSEAMGYANAAAFCRALADAGLPPPGRIADEVRKLRDANAR